MKKLLYCAFFYSFNYLSAAEIKTNSTTLVSTCFDDAKVKQSSEFCNQRMLFLGSSLKSSGIILGAVSTLNCVLKPKDCLTLDLGNPAFTFVVAGVSYKLGTSLLAEESSKEQNNNTSFEDSIIRNMGTYLAGPYLSAFCLSAGAKLLKSKLSVFDWNGNPKKLPIPYGSIVGIPNFGSGRVGNYNGIQIL